MCVAVLPYSLTAAAATAAQVSDKMRRKNSKQNVLFCRRFSRDQGLYAQNLLNREALADQEAAGQDGRRRPSCGLEGGGQITPT